MAKTEDIEGGKATFRDRDELTAGQSRAIARVTRRLPKRAVVAAAEADGEVETDLMGFPVDLTDDEVEATWEFNDVLLLSRLASWTLDRPLPKTREDLEDLPATLYASLNATLAKLIRPDDVDGFSVDAIEDQTAPTGA